MMAISLLRFNRRVNVFNQIMEHVPPLEDQLSVLRGKNRAEFLDRLFFDYISREPQRALSFAQQVLWTAETQQDLISTAAALGL
jgi:hypothetical protein